MLIAAGLALIGAGLALLTLLGVDSSWWLFLPGLLVAMVGTGIFNPTLSQVALSSAPPEQSGLAAGVNDMFRQAGIAVGVAALGALIPARRGVRRRLPAGLRRRLPRRAVGRRRAGLRGGGDGRRADRRGRVRLRRAVALRRGGARRRVARRPPAPRARAPPSPPGTHSRQTSSPRTWRPARRPTRSRSPQIAIHDALNAIDPTLRAVTRSPAPPARRRWRRQSPPPAHDTLVRLVAPGRAVDRGRVRRCVLASVPARGRQAAPGSPRAGGRRRDPRPAQFRRPSRGDHEALHAWPCQPRRLPADSAPELRRSWRAGANCRRSR